MRWRIEPSLVGGSAHMPGDKSIGHRALMLAGLAHGQSTINGLPAGADVLATAKCMTRLHAHVQIQSDVATVMGRGHLSAPDDDLDARNSGTTMRLLAGLLAGQPFRSRLIGDDSLSRRPMNRVVEPLARMGARIKAANGTAPLDIDGSPLHAIAYTLPVASAQVKSAILLAALFAEGTTSVTEPIASRDHTERMLRSAGVPVERHNGTISVRAAQRLRPFRISIPGDLSSAAFFITASLLTGGEIQITDVGINPTRAGFLDVIQRMGARVEIRDLREEMGEPVATVAVTGRVERSIQVVPDEVPLLLDELPLIVLLATQARGTSTIEGAAELRVKESDRISGVARSLGTLGATIEEKPDGMAVRGPTPLVGTTVSGNGDHRVAMMLAVAGTISRGQTIVEGAEAASVSYPGFAAALRVVGGKIDDF